MYVRDFMSPNPVIIAANTKVGDAIKLMEERDVHRLPVVEKGKLVGLVTRNHLRKATPSMATTLSVWELNYLLAKITVSEVMERKIITVSPNLPMEDLISMMRQHRIATFPVVEGEKLVGIVTVTDIMTFMANALGVGQPGTRVHLVEADSSRPEVEVFNIICQKNARVRAMFRTELRGGKGRERVFLLDKEHAAAVVDELRALGYEMHVETR